MRLASFALQVDGREYLPRQHAIAEAGSEALNLRFDARQHVERGAVGNVAVSPGNMPAFGCASRVEQAWLSEKHERLLGVVAVAHRIFRGRYFFQCAAEMHRGGSPALGSFPRNGIGQGIVDLEDARPVAKALKIAPVGRREPTAGDAQ